MKKLLLMIGIVCVLSTLFSCTENVRDIKDNTGLLRADTMLTAILSKYKVDKYGLLQENYPPNPENRVTYLSSGIKQRRVQEVCYLWPYSSVLSGCISLYKVTSDKYYLQILEDRLLPGLESYWDTSRLPYCYQSSPMFNGKSDRFYDNNQLIAINLIDLYGLTGNKNYLSRAEQLHRMYTADGMITWKEGYIAVNTN